MKALVNACRANQVTDFIVLHEHRGNPGLYIMSSFVLCHVTDNFTFSAIQKTS